MKNLSLNSLLGCASTQHPSHRNPAQTMSCVQKVAYLANLAFPNALIALFSLGKYEVREFGLAGPSLELTILRCVFSGLYSLYCRSLFRV
jgi:hypothetical protein